MDLVLISTSATWWERLSPLKQRAHVARHPKGKIAKHVISGKYKLKPMRDSSAPIPVGEAVDTPEEHDALMKYAHVGVEDLKEANADSEEQTKEGDAEEQTVPQQPLNLPKKSKIISEYQQDLSAESKAGVASFYEGIDDPDMGNAIPSGNLGNVVRNNPDNDEAVVDQFGGKNKKVLLATYKALKPLAKKLATAAGLLALGTMAVATGSVVPAILAAAYMSHRMEEAAEARAIRKRKEEADNEDGVDLAVKKRNKKKKEADEKLRKQNEAFMKEKLSPEDYRTWKKATEQASASSSRKIACLCANAEDEGVTHMVTDFMDWFTRLDHDELKQSLRVSSTSASTRLILSPTLKFFEPQHHKQYLIVTGTNLLGTVTWDIAMGDPSPDKYGWKVTLRDGFVESSYHSGRDPQNKYSPYTVIHNGEIKLHNPTRMNLETAFAWAKTALKGNEDDEDDI